MSATIDTLNTLYIKYLPGVRKTLNNTTLARTLPKQKKKWEGEHLEFAIHTKRNPAVANVVDGGNIPAADQQTHVKGRAGRRFTVGQAKATEGSLKTAASTMNAAISTAKSELGGMLDGIRKYENIMSTRDGTGTVCVMGATASGATFTVDDARPLWDKAHFEIRDATTTTTIHDSFQVSSVGRTYDNTLGSATVTPVATLAASGQAAGDLVVWKSTGAVSSWGNAITGYDKLIDDSVTGTFQNVTLSANTRYTSPVQSAVGALQPSDIRKALASIRQESGNVPGSELVLLGNTWSGQNIEQFYEGELRMNETSTVGGFKVSSFQSVYGQVKLVMDPDSPYGKLFFIDPSQIGFGVQSELDWRRVGGSIFQPLQNSLNQVATCFEICDMFIDQRNACTKLEGITESIQTAY